MRRIPVVLVVSPLGDKNYNFQPDTVSIVQSHSSEAQLLMLHTLIHANGKVFIRKMLYNSTVTHLLVSKQVGEVATVTCSHPG